MNKPCTHFVFWPYDAFPFVLGALAYKDRDYWVAPSYGHMKLPVKYVVHVAGLEEGAQRWERLQTLRGDHLSARLKIDRIYQEHAKAAAPWLARVSPYKAPRAAKAKA